MYVCTYMIIVSKSYLIERITYQCRTFYYTSTLPRKYEKDVQRMLFSSILEVNFPEIQMIHENSLKHPILFVT